MNALEAPVANLTSIVFHALPPEDQRRFVEGLQAKRRRTISVALPPIDMDEVIDVPKPKRTKKPKAEKKSTVTVNSIINSYTL